MYTGGAGTPPSRRHTPVWVVMQANQYAKDHGKTPFVVYQEKWNIMDRSFECDIIPIARSLGLALAPSPRINSVPTKKRNAAGKVERKDIPCMGWTGNVLRQKSGCLTLLKRLRKSCHCVRDAENIVHVPIICGRKVVNLKANMAALDITEVHIKELESVILFMLGSQWPLLVMAPSRYSCSKWLLIW
ncbi:hypothetical protein BDP27DRAFT_1362056 [Rhodocollybia butyracea]|uniref:Uncharacterized protein n=1 Tax=Rhodocollybia butyracea TaxID=206335 RepID=A0A9P5PZS2_9AGAR|nr:hypothetical protein BDP27DRAFT_1362056 [Rhodocollybia butyracea]